MTRERAEPLETLRRILLALFFFGALGTGVELLLLGHNESAQQLVPLGLIGLALVAVVALSLSPQKWSLHFFRALMVAFMVSSLAGLYFHYQSNAEFELEMYPSLAGGELFMESLKGAIPALAPGMMAFLGLLGMASTYRHPKGALS